MDEKQKKLAKIMMWLKEVFKGDISDSFEINDATLTIMEQIMERNKKNNLAKICAQKEWEESSEFYEHEAKRLSGILNHCGFSDDVLSQDSGKNISCLSCIAHTFNIEKPSISNISLAIMKMEDEKLKFQSLVDEEERASLKTELVLEKQLSIFGTIKDLHAYLNKQHLEDNMEAEEKSRRTSFLHLKTKEYASNINKLKNELTLSGLDSQLRHNNLVMISKELEADQEELKEKKRQLASYNSISPNIDLAKVELEEARRELASFEAQLSSQIDLMHS